MSVSFEGVSYGGGSSSGEATSGPDSTALSHRNKIINGAFAVNQRVYVSGAVLASGSYGHDRWKAGAGGGDYTFTQSAHGCTITIASSKTLIQVVEDKNVHATSYVLSWTGTAQARYAVNSATPAGSYAASPILITGQTVGTTMSVEFNSGTVSNVQLEAGATATPFESRPYGTELALCQRYYERWEFAGQMVIGMAYSTTQAVASIRFAVPKRAAPTTVTLPSPGQTAGTISFSTGTLSYPTATGTHSVSNVTASSLQLAGASYTGLTTGQPASLYGSGTVAILLDAEL